MSRHVLHANWTKIDPEILPEERLLFDLAKVNPSDADVVHALTLASDGGFSWTRAWAIATRLWVHPLVAKNIRDRPELAALTPRELKPILALSQFMAKTRYATYAEATAPAFAQLASAGVPVVLLKGAAMVSRYPAGTRLLNDLDLLIRRDDYRQVAAVLEACGFQRVLSKEVRTLGKGEAFQLRTSYEMSFVKRTHHSPLSLDVHWSLLNPDMPFVIDVNSLLERTVRVQFGDGSALALSPEDTLINYGAQLVTDNLKVNFLRLADMHALVTGDVSWASLCDRAIRAQAAGAVHLVLSGARLLDAEVPEEVLQKLEAACRGCSLASQIVADPRWPLDRFRLASSARTVLMPRFCSSTQYRRGRIRSLPVEAFRFGRRSGRSVVQSVMTALWAIVLTLVSALAVLGASIERSIGTHVLTAPLRRLLWRRVQGS